MKATVLKHFGDVLTLSNCSLVFKQKKADTSFKLALMTKMHPALPNVNKIVYRYNSLIRSCPILSKILPRDALIFVKRKLPDLASIWLEILFIVLLHLKFQKGSREDQTVLANCVKRDFLLLWSAHQYIQIEVLA